MPPEHHRRFAWPLAAACSVIFLLAALLGGPSTPADIGLIQALSVDRAAYPAVGQAAIVATQLGGAPAMLAILVAGMAALATARRWRAALLLGLVVLSGRIAVETLKIVIDRPRPDFGPYPVFVSSLSFPSGHAANSMMTFLAMALILAPERSRRPAIAAAAIASIVIGATRPFLGVHWASDVIGGWAFGIVWVIVGIELGLNWRAPPK
jgi:undecaprenyl-diphosphatase